MTIMAANGQPFTDRDAAEFKRRTLEEQLGERFTVKPKAGGWVVEAAKSTTSPAPAYVEGMDGADEDIDVRAPGSNRLWRNQFDPQSGAGKPAYQAPPHPLEEVQDDLKHRGARRDVTADDDDDRIFRDKVDSLERETASTTLVYRPAARAFLKYHMNALIGILFMAYPEIVWRLVAGVMAVKAEYYNMSMQLTVIVGLLILLFNEARFFWIYFSNRYVITPDAVETYKGIIARTKKHIKLVHIRSADVHQTFLERMLGVGHVALATAGTGGYDIVLKHISWPSAVEQEINERVQRSRHYSYTEE